jgi:hypothetical protein
MSQFPVFEIDYLKHPQLADNIWQAQMAKAPRVLTRCDAPSNKANRDVVMKYQVNGERFVVPKTYAHDKTDRDEYPFACTLEGGEGAWIGHVHFSQNRAMGRPLRDFFEANGVEPYPAPNCKFEVRVLNHPRGPVVP